ncbi:hypothetical protein EP331_01020 [bacterium]|nr:MAG: hypothetical protein EP331_01020 [bacterium]
MKHVFLLLICIIGATTISQAQKSSANRILFSISMGTGYSNLKSPHQSVSEFDLAYNWQLGYFLTQQSALVLNGSSSIYAYKGPDRNRKRGFEGLFASYQYWIKPALWISAGAGLNLDTPVFYDVKPSGTNESAYYPGFGSLFSAGYDFNQLDNFRFNIQLRAQNGFSNLPAGRLSGYSVSLLVGITILR